MHKWEKDNRKFPNCCIVFSPFFHMIILTNGMEDILLSIWTYRRDADAVAYQSPLYARAKVLISNLHWEKVFVPSVEHITPLRHNAAAARMTCNLCIRITLNPLCIHHLWWCCVTICRYNLLILWNVTITNCQKGWFKWGTLLIFRWIYFIKSKMLSWAGKSKIDDLNWLLEFITEIDK